MLRSNEHNKFTTLYYLLVKRNERGDLELEKELEEYAESEVKRERDRVRQLEREKSRKSQVKRDQIEAITETKSGLLKSQKSREIHKLRILEHQNSRIRPPSSSISNRPDSVEGQNNPKISILARPNKVPQIEIEDIDLEMDKPVVRSLHQGNKLSAYEQKRPASKSKGSLKKRGSAKPFGLKM